MHLAPGRTKNSNPKKLQKKLGKFFFPAIPF
jgi:hypothetical protein